MLTPTTRKALLFWLLLGVITSTLILRLDYASISQHREGLVRTLEQNLQKGLAHEAAVLQHAAHLADRYRPLPFHLQDHLHALLNLSTAVQQLYLMQRVEEPDVDAFLKQMRRRQPGYQLQGLSPMTLPPVSPDSGNPVHHPVIMALSEGEAPAPWQPGTDPGLSPAHRAAVMSTPSADTPHYSQVYRLQQGGPAVSLYVAVGNSADLLGLTASLSDLLDAQDLPAGSVLNLVAGDKTFPVLSSPPDVTPLFYLPQSFSLQLDEQTWQLAYDYPVFWHQLSWGPQLLALVLNTLGSLLFLAWLRQRDATTSCRLESQQVHQLQQHLQQHSQALQEQLNENQLLTHRILDIQERERRHLAQELHDELGQCLTAIRTDARMLLQDHPDPDSSVHQHSENIDSIAGHIYDVTYDLMHALRPTLLDDLGLVDALRELVGGGQLERQGIRVDLALKGALNEMGERYNITLYRLIQEALTNIQRHAQCRQVSLRLERLDIDTLDDRVELEISDNGQGFDPADQRHSRRFGLLGMQARVRALHGEFDLHSQPGEGTRISIRIPLVAAEVRGEARPSATESVVPPRLDANRQPA